MRLTDDQIEQAGSVNIVDVCQAGDIPLVLHHGQTYRHADFDSLKITGSKWRRFSNKTALLGKYDRGNAISFVREYMGLDFQEAVMLLLTYAGHEKGSVQQRLGQAADEAKARNAAKKKKGVQEDKGASEVDSGEGAGEKVEAPPAPPPVKFTLPGHNTNSRQVLIYLVKERGIDEEIVREMIKKDIVYEDVRHNCVFVGHDENNTPKYAGIKGTYVKDGKSFTGDVEGSKKRFGWHYTPAIESNTLRVYESPIDAMSHMAIIKNHGNDWRDVHYLSLGGLTRDALNRYLKIHSEIQVISLCLDNDEAGKKAISEITKKLENRYTCTDNSPTIAKDYNEALIMGLRKKEGGI